MTRQGGWARWAVVACSCGAMTVLAGCSSGTSSTTSSASAEVSPAASTPASQAVSSASAAAVASAVAPLTGLPATDSVAERPAVAVAVSGTNPAGLGAADLVYQEITSPVRYLAVYQSNEATVGPVGGTRPEDGQILSVLHPLTSYDGGTSTFVKELDATKIVDAGYAAHSSLYAEGTDGLTTSTSAVAATGTSDTPPPGLFSYRGPGASLASVKETHPTSVRINMPGQPAEQWTFSSSSDRWVLASGGPRVSVANLVVQIVPFKTVYLSRKYGETTQSTRVLGKGAATVFSGTTPGGSGGTAAAGSWYKPGLAGLTNYFDAASVPMNFGTGPTWIVLAPTGTTTSQAGG
jgi:hypothetical protein